MTRVFSIILSLFLFSSVCPAAQDPPISSPVDKGSYSLGYTFGKNLRAEGVTLNPEILLRAVRDGLEAKAPAMGQDEIRETLTRLEEQMRVAQKKRVKESVAKSLEEGKAFLEKNKEKPGVKSFPDGLQYKVLVEGKGESPKATDTVTVNYRGSLIDGTLFDSSYTRGQPENLRVSGVIKGWTEALEHMTPGSKWEIYVPPELGYGAKGFNKIPPNSVLIFEIELVSINKKADVESSGKTTASKPAQ